MKFVGPGEESFGASEQVRLECYWQGGNRTSHKLVRPVAKLKALSIYPSQGAFVSIYAPSEWSHFDAKPNLDWPMEPIDFIPHPHPTHVNVVLHKGRILLICRKWEIDALISANGVK